MASPVPNTTAVCDVHNAPTPVCLDNLRVEQLWQGHPAGLGYGACGLPACWLHPLAEVGQQGRGIRFEAVRQEEWHTTRCEHLYHLMHHPLRYSQRAAADIDHHQELACGVHRRPHPGRCTLQTRDGFIVIDLTRFEVSQHRV